MTASKIHPPSARSRREEGEKKGSPNSRWGRKGEGGRDSSWRETALERASGDDCICLAGGGGRLMQRGTKPPEEKEMHAKRGSCGDL